MAFPWETAAAGTRTAAKLALPWDRPETSPAPAPAPVPGPVPKRRSTPSSLLPWERDSGSTDEFLSPEPPTPRGAPPGLEAPEPEGEGLLSKLLSGVSGLGYALDTAGAYTRGALAGKAGQRVSGQDLLEEWGLFRREKEDAPLLSGKGAAGFLAEVALDPLNLLPGFFGIKAASKAGRAAAKLAPHLDEAAKSVRAWKGLQTAASKAPVLHDLMQGERAVQTVAPEALQAAERAVMDHPVFGRLVDDAGNLLPEDVLARQAAQRGTKVGQSAADVLANPKGFHPRPLKEAAERVRAGQESTFSIGGEYSPIPLPWIADKIKFDLPEVALVNAPRVNQALSKIGQGAKALPGVGALGKLFGRTPEEQAITSVERSAQGLRDIRSGQVERQAELARTLNSLPPGSPERLAAEAELERLIRETTPPAPAQLPPELAPRRPSDELGAEDLDEILSEPVQEAPRIGGLRDVETGEPIRIPGAVPEATNPAFIKRQFAEERARTLAPWEEAAPERLAAESRKAKALGAIDDMGLKPGSVVEYTPKGFKKPKRAKGELAGLPPELAATLRTLEQDTNKAIDAAHWQKLEEIQASATNSPGANAKLAAMERTRLRRDFAGTHGKFPLESDPIKGKATALPKAIEAALESGAPPEVLGLKGVEFLSADAAGLMPGDKINLAGDVFRVLEDSPPGKVKLKDGHQITVPDDAVPFDKGTQVQRAGAQPPAFPIQAPGKRAGAMTPEQARAVQQGLDEDAAARAMPGTAEFMQTLGREARSATPPPATSKPLPQRLEEIATRREAERLAKRQARDAATKRAVETPPPELQARIDELTQREARALKAAQAHAEAVTYAQEAGVKNPGAVVPKDLDPEAARKTADLMKRLAGFSPAEGREFLEAVEGTAKNPEAARKYAQEIETWHAHHNRLSEYEKATAGASQLSSEGGLGYALHLSEPGARETFQAVYKDPAKARRLHDLLNARREAKGLPPIDFRAGQAAPDAERLAQMDPEVRRALEKVGLSEEYLARTAHPSMIARAYKGLGITEINEAFRQAGYKPVFSENPAKLMYARQMRNLQVRTQADFMDELVNGGAGLALPGELARGAPVSGRPGVELVQHGGRRVYTVPELNASTPGRAIGFDSPELAEAAARTHRKMTTPEEVSPVLAWYDHLTRLWKSYLTRAFPAYHVRNHISNRLQGWMFEDVPVTGEHYRKAKQLLAGKDFTLQTGDGLTLTRQQLMDEGLRAGMGRGGFYEDLLDDIAEHSGAGAGSPRKGTWNPLDPNNKFINAAERVSAGLASAPGAALSGTPGMVKKATGATLENGDRWGAYIHFRQQGFTPGQAVEKVNRALFDYSRKNLGAFEREGVSRAVFFYTYVRNVIPRVFETVLRTPRKLSMTTHLSQSPGQPEPMPKWAGEGLAVPIGNDEQGRPMLATGLGTPVEAALEPFAGFGDGLGRGLAKLGSSLNPMLKIPIELATGKDLFLGRDIEDLKKAPHYAQHLPKDLRDVLGITSRTVLPKAEAARALGLDQSAIASTKPNAVFAAVEGAGGRKEYRVYRRDGGTWSLDAQAPTDRKGASAYFDKLPSGGEPGTPGTYTRNEMDPFFMYALRNSPASRISNTISRAADVDKGGGEVLANLLTGARVVSVDPERERQLQERDQAIATLKDLERQGLVYGFSLPEMFGLSDEAKEQLSPEDLERLKALVNQAAGRPAKGKAQGKKSGAEFPIQTPAPARPRAALPWER